MPRFLKWVLIMFAACIFLFMLARIGTSTYENYIRSIGSKPYT